MLKTIKPLHAEGFALIWIKEKSKAPVGDKWTKGPRKTWAQLLDEYRPGFNVGVRLGVASATKNDSFLAVIDCDVKSEEPRHLIEMETKLKEFLPIQGPTVISGRGNGSRHCYTQTKTPAMPRRLAQSSEKVKVKMPSVKPSKTELVTLTKEELADGFRLRAAWELSLMGEGQQVLLPPSIHPDSGRAYEWGVKFLLGGTPWFEDAQAPAGEAEELKVTEDFKVEAFDLKRLPERQRQMIEGGEGVDDRSAALFGVTMAMLKEGFTHNQVLSVLTDPSLYLGQAAYDHAKTKSRAKAAEWVREYTLAKGSKTYSSELDFAEAPVIAELPEAEAAALRTEVLDRPWWDLIERAGNDLHPKTSLNNINLILSNALGAPPFRKNLFSNNIEYAVKPPWNSSKAGDVIYDDDTIAIMHWLARTHRLESNDKKIFQAVTHLANQNSYHPVRDFLNGLEWDGVPRLDGWLSAYLGAVGPSEYLAAVSRKVLCAMVARVMVPGIKFDQVLIMEGDQGIGKSTTVRILSAPWFSDAHIDIGDKDAVIAMQSVWVLELGELTSIRKTDLDMLKSFVSRQTDRLRLPYGRIAVDLPRQCVFIGTTNDEDYLQDPSGNRRFWPVAVGQCDFEGLKRDRDQLLAEARFAWELGEKLYMETPELEALAKAEQEARLRQDEWVNLIAKELQKNDPNFDAKKFTILDLFSPYGPLEKWSNTHGIPMAAQQRAASALKILGYERKREQVAGVRTTFWVK